MTDWVVNDRLRVVWNVFVERQIVHIDMHADPDASAAGVRHVRSAERASP
jgi:hypothetical protein